MPVPVPVQMLAPKTYSKLVAAFVPVVVPGFEIERPGLPEMLEIERPGEWPGFERPVPGEWPGFERPVPELGHELGPHVFEFLRVLSLCRLVVRKELVQEKPSVWYSCPDTPQAPKWAG